MNRINQENIDVLQMNLSVFWYAKEEWEECCESRNYNIAWGQDLKRQCHSSAVSLIVCAQQFLSGLGVLPHDVESSLWEEEDPCFLKEEDAIAIAMGVYEACFKGILVDLRVRSHCKEAA